MLQKTKKQNFNLKPSLIKTNFNYYIESYGCQMNVYDSEIVSGLLESEGFYKTDELESADVILLNTCSIREKAEETVHNRLSYLAHLKNKKPSLILGVLGCMAQNIKNDILENKPFVDLVLGPDSYRKLIDFIHDRKNKNSYIDTRLSRYEVYDNLFPKRSDKGINAWVSIMRGCDKFCTFCIVPFTRGRERSKSINNILLEIHQAVSQGFCEITLLGQNVNSYSTEDGDFAYLLEQVALVPGVKRVRYTSPHPSDINEDVLYVMKKYDNICNHIHLPLQAGSSRILKRMNRTYTKDGFLSLVSKIKDIIPDCILTTDIIVGFPGESKEDFQETLEVVKSVGFHSSFMFKYSIRLGTKAAQYTDHIPEDKKQKRLESLIKLQKGLTLSKNLEMVGKTLEVIIEKESKKSPNQWAGRTNGNVWVVMDKKNKKIKDIANVLIKEAKGITLFGDIIN